MNAIPDFDRELLTITEACDVMRVSRRTLYNWIYSGRVEACRTPTGYPRVFADTLVRPLESGLKRVRPGQ